MASHGWENLLGISCSLQDEKTNALPSNIVIIITERISCSIKCGLINMPCLASIWGFCLLLCTARLSVATVLNNNLDPLTGSHDTALLPSTFPSPPNSWSADSLSFSGNTTPNGFNNDQGDGGDLDLPTNGNRGPESFPLSESNDCRFEVDQVPREQRRRIKRGEDKACLSDYPITSPGNGDPSDPNTSTSSQGSQDTPGEAGAEGQALDKESALSQSPPAADPFRCPYPNRPIPVCGSYIWARNALSPYTLPSCTPSMCLSPLFHTRSYLIEG